MKRNKEITVDELKKKMDECEEAYKASFKINSCSMILNTYHAWKDAKKQYYYAAGIRKSSEQDDYVINNTDSGYDNLLDDEEF